MTPYELRKETMYKRKQRSKYLFWAHDSSGNEFLRGGPVHCDYGTCKSIVTYRVIKALLKRKQTYAKVTVEQIENKFFKAGIFHFEVKL